MTSNASDRNVIQVAFYKLDDDEDESCAARNQNKITAWWTDGDVSHVELMFPSDGMSCSIIQDSTVHFQKKRFGGTEYGFFRMKLQPEQYNKVRAFCAKQYKEQKHFNGVAMYWNFLPVTSLMPKDNKGESWFCSELVTAALQQAGFFKDVKPYVQSPNSLFKLCKQAGFSVCMNPQYAQRYRQKFGNVEQ